MLSFFQHLFVQNEASKQLLDSIGMGAFCTVSGDTRFDRVIDIAENSAPIPIIEQFTANHKAIIAGSTWKEDEELLKKTMLSINSPTLKLVIAPHEIHPEHISQLLKLFPSAVLYSRFETSNPASLVSDILIIDNIGMLSRLYKYAYVTYIGGGFGKGIHNTLEAAVYAKPVIFGPAYHKFNEAIGLINAGGATSINKPKDCTMYVEKLLRDQKEYSESCNSAGDYVYANRGATKKIMQFIQEKRLLTN
jgi:3-deoxy-D-manno-octulosonic-acid transferase